MREQIDLTGTVFGKLLVMSKASRDKRYHDSMWNCKCECGNITVVSAGNLKKANTTSCGCYGAERRKQSVTTHGKSGTRLHRIWKAMHTRCYNANFFAFKYYGGRGVTICPEWRENFEAFYDWAMLSGYTKNLTIDRIDANGDYSTKNCRWSTMAEQNNNKRAPNGYKVKE